MRELHATKVLVAFCRSTPVAEIVDSQQLPGLRELVDSHRAQVERWNYCQKSSKHQRYHVTRLTCHRSFMISVSVRLMMGFAQRQVITPLTKCARFSAGTIVTRPVSPYRQPLCAVQHFTERGSPPMLAQQRPGLSLILAISPLPLRASLAAVDVAITK